jgi:hypothetical protein
MPDKSLVGTVHLTARRQHLCTTVDQAGTVRHQFFVLANGQNLPARLGVLSTTAQRRSPSSPSLAIQHESSCSPPRDLTGYRQISLTFANE